MVYKDIKNGEYFKVNGSSSGIPTAFGQTNDNETFKEYYGNKGKGFNRSMPTRLWDGAYHGIDDDCSVEVIEREEAISLVKAYRNI